MAPQKTPFLFAKPWHSLWLILLYTLSVAKAQDVLSSISAYPTNYILNHILPTDFYCPSEGFFADDYDCRLYYRCETRGNVYIKPYQFACKEGTVFSRDLKLCMPPILAGREECMHYMNEIDDTDNGDDSRLMYDIAHNSNKFPGVGIGVGVNVGANIGDDVGTLNAHNKVQNYGMTGLSGVSVISFSTTSSRSSNDADGTPPCYDDGFMSDPKDCTVFYRCISTGHGFNKIGFRCSDGTAWDDTLQSCNHLTEVRANGGCRGTENVVHDEYAGQTSTQSTQSNYQNTTSSSSSSQTQQTSTSSSSTSSSSTSSSTTNSSSSSTQSTNNNNNQQQSNATETSTTSSSNAQSSTTSSQQTSSSTTSSSNSSSSGSQNSSTNSTANQASNNNQTSNNNESSNQSIIGNQTSTSTSQGNNQNNSNQNSNGNQSIENSTECHNDETYIADKYDCAKFYRCRNDGKGGLEKVPFTCGPGTIWNQKDKVCDLPTNAQKENCKISSSNASNTSNQQSSSSSNTTGSSSSSSNQQSSQSSSTANNQSNSQSSSSNNNQQSTTTQKPFNPDGNCKDSETYLADKKDCTRFYRCVNNGNGSFDKIAFDCAPGTVWDPDTKGCNHPTDVQKEQCKVMAGTTGSSTSQSSTTQSSGSTTSSGNSNQQTVNNNQTSSSSTESTSNQSTSTSSISTSSQSAQSSTTGSSSNQQSSTSSSSQSSSSTSSTESNSSQSSTSNNTTSSSQSSTSTESNQSNSTSQSSTSSSNTSQQTATQSSNTSSTSTQQTNATSSSSQNSTSTSTSSGTTTTGETTSKPEGKCDKNTQFLSDQKDCAKFYRCVENGKGGYDNIPFTCGPGTVWDSDIQACNHAWAVKNTNCGTTSSTFPTTNTPQTKPTSAAPPTSKPIQQPPTQLPIKPTTSEPHTDKPGTSAQQSTTDHPDGDSTTSMPIPDGICKEDGFVGDPKDCTRFYRCVSNGKGGFTTYPFKCGKGTVWDSSLQTCNHDLNMCNIHAGGSTTTEWQKPTTLKPETTSHTTMSTTQVTQQTDKPGYPTTTQHPQSTATESGKDPTTTTTTTWSSVTSTMQPTTTYRPSAPITADAQCKQEGFFGDANDCRKFYRCVDNGKGDFEKYTFKCGNNTVWDAEIEGCNHPSAVKDPKCGTASTTTGSSFESTTTSSTEEYPTTTNKYDSTAKPTTTPITHSPSHIPTETTNAYPSTTESGPTMIQTPTTTPVPNLPPGTECKGEGFMADPNNCRKFYRCVKEGDSYSRHEFMCAKGTGWSEEKQTCDYAEYIDRCAGQTESPEINVTTTTMTSTTYPTSSTPIYEKPTDPSAPGYEPTTTDFTTTTLKTTTTESQTNKPGYTTTTIPTTTAIDYTTTNSPISTTPIPNLPSGKQCTGEGYMADPDNCRKFYRCVQNGDKFIKHEFICAKGTGWNEEKQTCDYAEYVDRCRGQTEEPEMSTTTEMSTKPTEPTKPSETSIKPTETTEAISQPTQAPTDTPTKPTESSTQPTEASSKPNEAPTKPTEISTYPPATPTNPTETSTKPTEIPTKPTEISTKPTETSTKPTETPTKPTQMPTNPTEISTKPTETPTKPTTADPSTTSTADYTTTSQPISTTPIPNLPPGKQCTGQGFMADPDNCRKFYRCVQNGDKIIKHEFMCAKGTGWSEEKQTCDYAEYIDRCAGQTESPEINVTTTTMTSTTYPTSSTPIYEKPTDPSAPGYEPTTTDFTTTTLKTTTIESQTNKPGYTTTTIPTTTAIDYTTTSSPISTTPIPNLPSGKQCTGEGYMADPDNCRKFYRCVQNGDKFIKHEFICAKGTGWSEEKQTCDYAEYVDRCRGQTEEPEMSTTTEMSTKPSESTKPTEPPTQSTSQRPSEMSTSVSPTEVPTQQTETPTKPTQPTTTEISTIPTERPTKPTEVTEPTERPSTTQSTEKPTKPTETTETPTKPTEMATSTMKPGYEPTTISSTDFPTTTTEEYSTTTTEPINYKCTSEGFFPDPDDCNRYYRCVDANKNGQYQIYSFRCPAGTVWDTSLDTCNYASQVSSNCSSGATTASIESTTSTLESTTTTSETITTTTIKPIDTTTTGKPLETTTTIKPIDTTTTSKPLETTTTIKPIDTTTTGKPLETTTTIKPIDTTTTGKPLETTTTIKPIDTTTTSKPLETTTSNKPLETTTEIITISSEIPEQPDTTTQQSTAISETITSTTEQIETPTTENPIIETSTTTQQSPTTAAQSPTTGKPTAAPGSSTNTSTPCPSISEGQNLFVCPTGFRRHPRSCDLFYQCTEKTDSLDLNVVVFKCPNGTVFHENRNLCDVPNSNEQCLTLSEMRSTSYEVQIRNMNMVQIRSTAPLCPAVGHFGLNQDQCGQLFVKCDYSDATGRVEGQIYRCPQGFAYWSVSRRCERTQKLLNCVPSNRDASNAIPMEWVNIGNRRRNLRI